MAKERDIFRQAHELVRSGLVPLTEGSTSADDLDELQKHQLWLEQSNTIHGDLPPAEGTMTFEELALLGAMRLKYPSQEDAIWDEYLGGAFV